jgi:hypothetical protein
MSRNVEWEHLLARKHICACEYVDMSVRMKALRLGAAFLERVMVALESGLQA